MTLRPASVLAATGMTSASASGTQLKSRSLPSVSRTTTTASGAPRPGRPASRTAAAAVVPAATRIGAAGTGCAGAVIDAVSSGFRGFKRTRPCYRGDYSRRVPAVGLPGFQEDKQGLGISQHGVAVAQPARHEDLSPFHLVDSRVDLQLLVDRDDLAVIDVQVRGALAGTTGDHPRRHTQDGVEQQPERAAVDGAVAPQMKPPKTGPALDAAGRSFPRYLPHLHRHRQDVAAVGQIDAAARRRRPFVSVERAE